MPENAFSHVVEPALVALGEAVYVLDSAVKQLDARELSRYSGRQPLRGWRLALQFSDKIRQFDVLACGGFPWTAMRVGLVDGPPFLTWPHIERDGVICLADYGPCMTPDDTLDTLQRVISDAMNLIEMCLEGKFAAEFRDEFSTYWGYEISGRDRYLTSICDPRGAARPISAWMGKNHVVAGDATDPLHRWLKNYGASVKEDGKDIGPGLFIPLPRAPLPREYPRSLSDLRDLVSTCGPDAEAVFEQVTQSGRNEIPIVLGVATQRGIALAGLMLTAKTIPGVASRFGRDKNGRGFRPGKVPPQIQQARLGGFYGVTRITAERADPAWIHGREADEKFTRLRDTLVVIVGCGSLGSAVAELLAKAGVGRFVLIDHDEMRWANVGRHELGAQGVYCNKATALKGRLMRDFPHIRDVEAVSRRLEDVLPGNGDFSKASVVIDATADWTAESMLNEWQRSAKGNPPVVYGWMEEHACAGHAVLIANGDDLLTGFDRAGALLYPATTWASGDQLRKEPGCGAVFQPYGPVELSHTAALVAELSTDVLLGNEARSTHRIWAARKRLLEDCGGTWSSWWSQNFPADDAGGVTRECAWPRREDNDNSKEEAA